METIRPLNRVIKDINDNKFPGGKHVNELGEEVGIYILPKDHEYMKGRKGISVSYHSKNGKRNIILVKNIPDSPNKSEKMSFLIYHEVGHFTLHKHTKKKNSIDFLTREIEANLYAASKMKKDICLPIIMNNAIKLRKIIIRMNKDSPDNERKLKLYHRKHIYYFAKLISYYYVKHRI